MVYHRAMSDVQISDRREDIDFEFVFRFLSDESIWADGIGRETQQRAIDNSLCISAFVNDQQVGFARAVTDYATFVWVDDVFVDPNARGKGVSKHLIAAIIEHPKLTSVASWWLSSSTPAARSLFEKFGFEVPAKERIAKWMGRPKVKSEAYRV
jgi:GNAT superfamily N-acetyltransferase